MHGPAHRHALAKPPIAPRRPRAASWHGIELVDDYAWLRDDNWQDVTNLVAAPLAFGRYGATLPAAQLPGYGTVEFKRFYPSGQWEMGGNHTVKFTAGPPASHTDLKTAIST